ncbi:hypothetical protein FB45DRAFT_457176 [Roridomyces roridus]|uniref:F-box domain-containing protein n=1 Tax=Roridomyces roridus TaxID=1738132 RepID=A0AAD7C2M3_9AGAR|nr:hypothetical protein FB45DRAFT_457176 [Roridomyces roridus]
MLTHAHRLGPDRPAHREIGGAANRIPTEIAIKISKYLSVKDLAHGAVAWRALASASQDTASFIRAECARFSLRILGSWTARTDLLPGMRDRIAQYNHAWSTLQYTFGQSFVIPQTAYDTPWAGSFEWRSGTQFMGESGGWTYNAHSRVQNEVFKARVSLYENPSLRTGEMGFKNVQIDVSLYSGYVKAVAVDSVARYVGVLEYSDQDAGGGYASIPILHVFHLDNGNRLISARLRFYGFPVGAEVYHMEIHGQMVCVAANYDSFGQGTRSDVIVQNWTGAGG